MNRRRLLALPMLCVAAVNLGGCLATDLVKRAQQAINPGNISSEQAPTPDALNRASGRHTAARGASLIGAGAQAAGYERPRRDC